MTALYNLTARNCKLFFKDKGVFFTSLITPLILLVLYVTFLAKVYKNSFIAGIPQGISISEKLINAAVGGQLVSSLLAVSCVTVAFCCNMISVQDKVSGARLDLAVSPVKKSTLAISYYISTLISTIIVCLLASVICLVYLSKIGWYLSGKDIALAALDIVLLVLFGTALSSIINCFLKTQGQISAVGTIVSSGYGFICGAYMPISQFGSGLQKVLSFCPAHMPQACCETTHLREFSEKWKTFLSQIRQLTQLRTALTATFISLINPCRKAQCIFILRRALRC